MRIAVKNDFVHALAKLAVTDGLEDFRILRKSIVVRKGGKRLTGNHFFAINMAGSGRFFGIVLSSPPVRELIIRLTAQPELALRDVHFALDLNLITLNRNTNAWCFSRKLDAPFMYVVGESTIKIVGKQVTDSATVVPEETFCLIQIPNKPTG